MMSCVLYRKESLVPLGVVEQFVGQMNVQFHFYLDTYFRYFPGCADRYNFDFFHEQKVFAEEDDLHTRNRLGANSEPRTCVRDGWSTGVPRVRRKRQHYILLVVDQ